MTLWLQCSAALPVAELTLSPTPEFFTSYDSASLNATRQQNPSLYYCFLKKSTLFKLVHWSGQKFTESPTPSLALQKSFEPITERRTAAARTLMQRGPVLPELGLVGTGQTEGDRPRSGGMGDETGTKSQPGAEIGQPL